VRGRRPLEIITEDAGADLGSPRYLIPTEAGTLVAKELQSFLACPIRCGDFLAIDVPMVRSPRSCCF